MSSLRNLQLHNDGINWDFTVFEKLQPDHVIIEKMICIGLIETDIIAVSTFMTHPTYPRKLA